MCSRHRTLGEYRGKTHIVRNRRTANPHIAEHIRRKTKVKRGKKNYNPSERPESSRKTALPLPFQCPSLLYWAAGLGVAAQVNVRILWVYAAWAGSKHTGKGLINRVWPTIVGGWPHRHCRASFSVAGSYYYAQIRSIESHDPVHRLIASMLTPRQLTRLS